MGQTTSFKKFIIYLVLTAIPRTFLIYCKLLSNVFKNIFPSVCYICAVSSEIDHSGPLHSVVVDELVKVMG